MSKETYPKLLLHREFDERSKFEMTERGCLTNALVELENGNRYEVFFVEPVRFNQDAESEIARQNYLAETAVVILPEVTFENIYNVLDQLKNTRFFDALVPLKRKWYFDEKDWVEPENR